MLNIVDVTYVQTGQSASINTMGMRDMQKLAFSAREVRGKLDLSVERCYRSKPFTSDEERPEYLFKLYEEMTSCVNDGGNV